MVHPASLKILAVPGEGNGQWMEPVPLVGRHHFLTLPLQDLQMNFLMGIIATPVHDLHAPPDHGQIASEMLH